MYTVNKENPKSWDKHFFDIAVVVASNSKCLSRKIGAVIVTPDNTIISTGYNGPPRDVQTCDKRWLTDSRIREHANFDYINRKGKFYQDHLKNKCPRYVPEMGFKSGEGLEWCVAGHAERNAIVNSAREGLHYLKGMIIYMSCGVPCTPCLVEIINSGIKEIVVTDFKTYDVSGKYLLDESKIKIRKFDFLDE